MKRIPPRMKNLEFDAQINSNVFNATFPISDGTCPDIGEETILGRAIKECSLITQASNSLIISAGLSAVATALQGHINVELPTGKICPVSLNLLTCADSGERKSTVEKTLNKGVKNFQLKHEESYRENLKKYEIFKGIHDIKTRKIKKKLCAGPVGGVDEGFNELLEHEKQKPEMPKSSNIIYEDSTLEALMSGLKNDSPNAYLGSSEGGVLINMLSESTTPYLNSIWSGDDVYVARKTTDSYILSDVRLTTHIMIQTQTFLRFMQKSQGAVRDNGYLCRFLVCFPTPVSGYRQTSGIKFGEKFIKIFHEKIEDFLNKIPPSRHLVEFSDEAKDIWLKIYNDIESKMSPGGVYDNAKDHASKLAENIARVAALIHYFEHAFDSKISVDALNLAVNLVSYYSLHFMNCFCPPPKEVVLGNYLLFFLNTLNKKGTRYVRKNYVLQFGPVSLRKRDSLNMAIGNLMSKGVISVYEYKKTNIIDLLPLCSFNQEKFDIDINLSWSNGNSFF
ncbi:YfjI family protein [Shewanella xiamenensis]|uniref:YfjI family protein n=1 Tax=Shewanella xiamenensis TaxID=332186 RepID=UPI00313DE71C